MWKLTKEDREKLVTKKVNKTMKVNYIHSIKNIDTALTHNKCNGNCVNDYKRCKYLKGISFSNNDIAIYCSKEFTKKQDGKQ